MTAENNLYKKTEKFVIDSFTRIGKEYEVKHLLRTVYWIRKMNKLIYNRTADEALLISAVAHDIERAYRKDDVKKIISSGFLSKKFLRLHQERGAEIISDFLKTKKANQRLIEKVKQLVSKHEEGGNEDQNLLKDADSLSFFECNVNKFLGKAETKGKEYVKEKFEWMYTRITSKKAKDIAKPLYEDAMKRLE